MQVNPVGRPKCLKHRTSGFSHLQNHQLNSTVLMSQQIKKLIFTQKQHTHTKKYSGTKTGTQPLPSWTPCLCELAFAIWTALTGFALVFPALHDIRPDCNINTTFSYEGIRRWGKSGTKQTKMNSAVCSLFVILLNKTRHCLDYIFRLRSSRS